MKIEHKEKTHLPAIDSSQPISEQELARLHQLEDIVDRWLPSFIAVGLALKEICDKKLYRQEADTFEIYMQKRFGMSPRRGYQLITGASIAVVVDEYEDDDPSKVPTSSKKIIIDNERKARILVGLTPKLQRKVARDAYRKALEENRKVTARDIATEAEKYREKKKERRNFEEDKQTAKKSLDRFSKEIMDMAQSYHSPAMREELDLQISQIEYLLEFLKEAKGKLDT